MSVMEKFGDVVASLDSQDAVQLDRRGLYLNPFEDPYAFAAIEAYCDSIERTQKQRADMIRTRFGLTRTGPTHCGTTFWKLFHRAWGSSKDHPPYYKRCWGYVQEQAQLAVGIS